jgi:hypothetical protein
MSFSGQVAIFVYEDTRLDFSGWDEIDAIAATTNRHGFLCFDDDSSSKLTASFAHGKVSGIVAAVAVVKSAGLMSSAPIL